MTSSQRHTGELKKSLAYQPNFPKGQTLLSPDFALAGKGHRSVLGTVTGAGRQGWVERMKLPQEPVCGCLCQETWQHQALESPMWPRVCQGPWSWCNRISSTGNRVTVWEDSLSLVPRGLLILRQAHPQAWTCCLQQKSHCPTPAFCCQPAAWLTVPGTGPTPVRTGEPQEDVPAERIIGLKADKTSTSPFINVSRPGTQLRGGAQRTLIGRYDTSL